MMKRSLYAGAVSLCAAAVLVACGGSSEPVQVAAADLTVNAAATNVAAVAGTAFSFPAGVAAFGTTAATTLTLAAPAAGASTNAFTLTSGTGTATGTTEYGSCIFRVSASTIQGIAIGQTITVNPCSIKVTTNGLRVDSSSTAGAQIILGSTTSTPVNVPVAFSRLGNLTIGNTSLGLVSLTPLTGT